MNTKNKRLLRSVSFFMALSAGSLLSNGQLRAQNVVFVGASITEGARLEHPASDSYPGQVQALLGSGYHVMNKGVSSTTMLRRGDHPYWETGAYQAALKANPDVVFIDLGGNDAKAVNRPFYSDLVTDCRDMIHSFSSLPSKPRVIVMLPFVSFETDSDQIWDPVITRHIIPKLRQAAYEEGVEVLNMHALLVDRPALFPDNIHPNKEGASIIARKLFQVITLQADPDFDLFKKIPQHADLSFFYGYACATFQLQGRECKVVKPRRTAKGRPWIWRARFWGHEPQTDIALLENGFHVVYCDAAELLGNEAAIALWNDFYALLQKAGLNHKAAMEGMSRGGAYVFNWAAANPDKVASVYADNALLDFKALTKSGHPLTADFKKAYHIQNDVQLEQFRGSPMDKVQQIVGGHYPILMLCADSDEVLNPAEQTLLFENKVKEQGGDITVLIKHNFRHHPHSFPNPAPIVDFILEASKRKLIKN